MEDLPWVEIMGPRYEGHPPIVDSLFKACCFYIEKRALDREGIFRVPGSAAQVRNLKEQYRKRSGKKGEVPLDLSSEEPNTVCSLLTDYLRTSEEPLLTFELADEWLATTTVSTDWFTRAQPMSALLYRLPSSHFGELILLLRLLVLVNEHAANNKMGNTNLATIFGPLILRKRNSIPAEELRDVPRVSLLCMDLLKMYVQLFTSPEPTLASKQVEGEYHAPQQSRFQRRQGLNMGQANGERRKITAIAKEEKGDGESTVDIVNITERTQQTQQQQQQLHQQPQQQSQPLVVASRSEPRKLVSEDEQRSSSKRESSSRKPALQQLSQMGQFYLKVDSRSLVRSFGDSGGAERSADIDYMRSIVSAGGIRLDDDSPDSPPDSGARPKVRSRSGPLVKRANPLKRSVGSARSNSKSTIFEHADHHRTGSTSAIYPHKHAIELGDDDSSSSDNTFTVLSDPEDSDEDEQEATDEPSLSPLLPSLTAALATSKVPVTSSAERNAKLIKLKRASRSCPEIDVSEFKSTRPILTSKESLMATTAGGPTSTTKKPMTTEEMRQQFAQKKEELERRRKELENRRQEIKTLLEADEAAGVSLHDDHSYIAIQTQPPASFHTNGKVGGYDEHNGSPVLRKWKLRQKKIQEETREIRRLHRRKSRSARYRPKLPTLDGEDDSRFQSLIGTTDNADRTAERSGVMAILERYYSIQPFKPLHSSDVAFPGIRLHTELAAPNEIEKQYPDAMRKQRERIEKQWSEEQSGKLKAKPDSSLSTISSWQVHQLQKLREQEAQLTREEEALVDDTSHSRIERQKIRSRKEEVQRRIREVELDIQEQEQERQAAREGALAALAAANSSPVQLSVPPVSPRPRSPIPTAAPPSPSFMQTLIQPPQPQQQQQHPEPPSTTEEPD
eukprot:TRINITY_DN3839_c6_g1_i1.p1 TRINITY_DN3839_c6_g1~~TRINITY_DN3839_c6_g1_i1.p1  ORF type:complete len:903 (-),score=160.31 TRINITY_DN3839_c6_g1_i1:115-2823(-)